MRQLTAQEWIKLGIERFGLNREKWQFVCPGCGNVQSSETLMPYRARGARPHKAYQGCIGCFNGRAEDPNAPGCLFSTDTNPSIAPLEIEYGPGHKMFVMDFAP